MKIIKQGIKPDESRKFKCHFCGCIFIAEKNEYSVVPMGYCLIGYKCDCPNCGASCYHSEGDD